jgi:exopolysaccharide production protein ExoQ
MKISYRALGNIFTFVVLFVSTGAFVSSVVGTSLESNQEGSPLTQTLWAALYLIVALRVIIRYRQIMPLVRANKSLCLLVLLTIASASWSQDVPATLHHSVALLGTTLFGIDIAIHYSIREQLRFAGIVLGSVIILSILTEIFLPGFLPHAAGASFWQGAFGQKNTFGKIVVLAGAAFLSRPRQSIRDIRIIVTLMTVAFALVIASHSASALVELVALVLISWTFGALRWERSKLILAAFLILIITIPTVYLALDNFDVVTSVLARDATLSGRTVLWGLTLESIARKPFLGHGYGVFWEFSSQEARLIRALIGWDAPSAHDGYLGLLLDVGLLGLLLFAVAYFVTVHRAVIQFKIGPSDQMLWPLLLLAEVFLCQLTETSVVNPNSIYWILFVAVAFSVSQPLIASESMTSDEDSAASEPYAVFVGV